jgi:hypothetical protein
MKRTGMSRPTREQLEAGEYDDEVDNKPQGQQLTDGELKAIQGRRIVKAKRYVQKTGEVVADDSQKAKGFQLAGGLSLSAMSTNSSTQKKVDESAPKPATNGF